MRLNVIGAVKSIGRFSKLTISKRLAVGFGVILALMIILTATGIWSLSGMNSKIEQIIKVNNTKIEHAYSIQNAINAIDKSVFTIVLSNDEATTKTERLKIETARAAYQTSMATLEKLETSVKGKEIIQELKQNAEISKGASDRAIETAASGNTQSAITTITGTMQISNMLGNACNDLVRYQQDQTALGAKDAQATYTRARLFLLIMGAVVFAFAVFLATGLAKSITKPLNYGASIAHKIAEGDLTARIETMRADETGQLLGAMQNMLENLQRIIGEVKAAATNMASASHELNANSELMSKGAGEQAGRALQVASASEEMSQTILDVAKNTSSIEISSTETAKLARNGEKVVDSSVHKVKAISETIEASAQLIRSLGDRSNQIGHIIGVINDIADQTNLLALNAAIEAARAGEAGRGFAVVADEVKKLAVRTSNSTSEISSMITSMQKEVHEVVASMETITREVTAGVELSTQAGDVLRNIVGSVDQLHVMVQQIASASEEMASTSEQISKDIETIATVSKETSGNSEGITKASLELAELSVNLEKAVAGFNV
ncbi:MAG: methyl-accepting chemotaxis protein [Deltaproteobacteria bacterium]|nr:methyl-accepting chemotaxis protein [Deltaproteobacteria bacterium]